MPSSNFNSGITLSKLNDEEFVWLRTGRIQNSGKREKFMEANKTYTCQFNNHTCQRYLIAGFCKILCCQGSFGILCQTKWYRGGLFLATTIFVCLPLKKKKTLTMEAAGSSETEGFLPVYKTAFFVFLSNGGRHCN